MKFVYPAKLTADRDDGGFVVTFPDFPDAVTQGDDEAEALANAADCIREAVGLRLALREEIPAPSALRGRPGVALDGLLAAKAALAMGMVERQITMAELARRLGRQHNEVRRLIDPKSASRMAAIEEALGAIGKRLVIEVRDGT